MDEVVVDGLLRQCASSLGYLIDETDPSITEGILIEVKLELCEPDVIFQPSLDTQIVGNFFDRMSGYIDDILHVCRLLPRVSHYNCSPVSDEKHLTSTELLYKYFTIILIYVVRCSYIAKYAVT